jgi:hypothetical protein
MTSKRAKSVYKTSLGTAGTLQSSRSTPMTSPQSGPVLDFGPFRGSPGECRIKYLEMLYDHTLGHDGVVMWTGAEILNWDRAQVGVVRQPIPE